jgi:hypothetical protein
MPIHLALVLALLATGVLVNLYLSRRRPELCVAAGTATTSLSLLVWLIAWPRLPLPATAGPAAGEVPFAAWAFLVDGPAWQLVFILHLLVLGLFLSAVKEVAPGDEDGHRVALPAAILSLALAATVGITAGNLATLLAAATLVTLTWLVALVLITPQGDLPASARHAAGLLPGVLFLALALATAGPEATHGLVPAAWQSGGRAWGWLAAIAWIGAFPFHWWRPRELEEGGPLAGMLHAAPALLGATLAVRLAGAALPSGIALLLTLFGLLGLASSASYIWGRIRQARPVIGGLFYAQAHLVLLAALWAGSGAALAETRVLILAGGLLWVASYWRETHPRALAAAETVAAAAVAGLPLTYGFAGRLGLYAALTDGFRIALLVVTALLTVPIIAAVVLLAWDLSGAQRLEELPRVDGVRVHAALLGLAVALLALPTGFTGREWLGTGVTLVVAGGGLAIRRAISRLEEAQEALRQAFRLPPLGRRAVETLQSIAGAMVASLREAVAIMEGEGGMLWLLALLVVLWLSRRV